MKTSLQMLHTIRLFNTIDIDLLATAIHTGGIQIRQYHKGQTIHHQEDPCTTMDVIITGKISINRYDTDGHLVHITQFKTNETLGGNLLFASECHYPFDISTLEKTTLAHINGPTLISLMTSNSEFLLKFLKDLSDKAHTLAQSIHALSEKTLRQKIVQYLQSETRRQNNTTVVLNTSKKLLAQRFGVARTSLSRELGAMASEGLIQFTAKTIEILDDF